jgi:kinesin family protein 18/19
MVLCVNSYGATGTGKTHTMIGSENLPGITVLTVADLFDAIEQTKHEKEYRLTMSYMEVCIHDC